MPSPSIDARIEEAVRNARLARPSVTCDRAPLVRALRDAVAADPAAAEATLAALHVADLDLALACAAGDPQALGDFDREILARVPLFLARHPARDHADEIRQRLRERLLVARPDQPARIAAYAGRGSLASWVRVAAVRAASNLVRDERPHDELPDEVPAAALDDVPELRVLEGRYKTAFRAAFRAAFAGLDAEERTILKLHFLDGVTVRQLAPLLGVSSATAGRRLLAAQQRLGEVVLAQLSATLDAPVADLESAVRELVSRLEVSLSALLG